MIMNFFTTLILEIFSFRFLALLLFWLPAAICVVGYTARTWRNIRKDVADRAARVSGQGNYYVPTDTIGTLVGRALVSFIPLANLWATFFDVGSEIFEKFMKWIGQFLDIPLVPGPKDRG